MCDLSKSEINSALEALAFKMTTPFCYACYREAPTGRCKLCGSDDLMRLLADSGCEYGTDWVIRDLLQGELEAINIDEAFEESISQCYEDTVKVGWLEVDTVTAIKQLDPVSWDLAKSEWIECEEDAGIAFSLDSGSTYYWTQDVLNLLKENNIDTDGAA